MKRIVIWGFALLVGVMVLVSLAGGGNEGEAGSPSFEEVAGDRVESTEDVADEADGPLALGEFHEYNKGFTGTAWNVAIDGYEWGELSPFAAEGQEGKCLVITGTATARVVDTDDGLSNPLSFPRPEVVVNGRKTPFDGVSCNQALDQHLERSRLFEMEFTEGATAGWYHQVWVPPGEVERVVVDGVDWVVPQ